MSFGLYAAGFAIVIGGLAYAAHLVHVPSHWIAVGVIVMMYAYVFPHLIPHGLTFVR